MAFNVQFTFIDSFNRTKTRTWVNTQALLADALTDVATLAGLYDAVGIGGMSEFKLTNFSTAASHSAEANSNVDENESIQVIAGDGYRYDFNLPMPAPGILLADGALNTADGDVIAFFDEFASGGTWRINIRNPTDIVTVDSGVLDK